MNMHFKPLVLLIALSAAAVSTASAALPAAESLGKLILHEFDTNTNDLVDLGEWQSGIEGSFEDLDANGDGSIESEEVNSITGDIADQTGEAAATLIVALIKQILLTLDTDSNKQISLKEYSRLSADVFMKLDADKNNALSLPELSELPLKLLVK
jgi:hypothetical protein